MDYEVNGRVRFEQIVRIYGWSPAEFVLTFGPKTVVPNRPGWTCVISVLHKSSRVRTNYLGGGNGLGVLTAAWLTEFTHDLKIGTFG